MIGHNTQQRHAVKSFINAYKKAFPYAFRKCRRLPKKKRDEMQKFINYVDSLRLTEFQRIINGQ